MEDIGTGIGRESRMKRLCRKRKPEQHDLADLSATTVKRAAVRVSQYCLARVVGVSLDWDAYYTCGALPQSCSTYFCVTAPVKSTLTVGTFFVPHDARRGFQPHERDFKGRQMPMLLTNSTARVTRCSRDHHVSVRRLGRL